MLQTNFVQVQSQHGHKNTDYNLQTFFFLICKTLFLAIREHTHTTHAHTHAHAYSTHTYTNHTHTQKHGDNEITTLHPFKVPQHGGVA